MSWLYKTYYVAYIFQIHQNYQPTAIAYFSNWGNPLSWFPQWNVLNLLHNLMYIYIYIHNNFFKVQLLCLFENSNLGWSVLNQNEIKKLDMMLYRYKSNFQIIQFISHTILV